MEHKCKKKWPKLEYFGQPIRSIRVMISEANDGHGNFTEKSRHWIAQTSNHDEAIAINYCPFCGLKLEI